MEATGPPDFLPQVGANWPGRHLLSRPGDRSSVKRSSAVEQQTAEVPMSGRKGERTWPLCQDWPSLLWLVNFGCIEFIPWNSRVATIDWPDYLAIDLDPEAVPFKEVVAVAQAVHKMLDKMGATNYCKTSGKRGLHICVPLGAQYTFAQSKLLGEIICRLVHQQLPSLTSRNPARSQRQGLIYLDQTRNVRGQSLAAAYCARPWPGATVSTPLKWSKVRSGLDPAKFTIRTVRQRVDRFGDLWQPLLGPGIDLAKVSSKFSVDG
jgi:bifunctional non-homologous end joining protein LigD